MPLGDIDDQDVYLELVAPDAEAESLAGPGAGFEDFNIVALARKPDERSWIMHCRLYEHEPSLSQKVVEYVEYMEDRKTAFLRDILALLYGLTLDEESGRMLDRILYKGHEPYYDLIDEIRDHENESD